MFKKRLKTIAYLLMMMNFCLNGTHIKGKGEKQNKENEKISQPSKKTIMCSIKQCGFSCHGKNIFEKHVKKKHTDYSKKYICNDCIRKGKGRAFKMASHFKDHITNVHEKIKHKCPVSTCGKLLSSTTAVRLHLKLKHNEEDFFIRKLNEKSQKNIIFYRIFYKKKKQQIYKSENVKHDLDEEDEKRISLHYSLYRKIFGESDELEDSPILQEEDVSSFKVSHESEILSNDQEILSYLKTCEQKYENSYLKKLHIFCIINMENESISRLNRVLAKKLSKTTDNIFDIYNLSKSETLSGGISKWSQRRASSRIKEKLLNRNNKRKELVVCATIDQLDLKEISEKSNIEMHYCLLMPEAEADILFHDDLQKYINGRYHCINYNKNSCYSEPFMNSLIEWLLNPILFEQKGCTD